MRLRHHRDFFKEASRLRSQSGQFYFLKLEELEKAKIAILLSKKKHGGAVERNRLRRRLKAAFSLVVKEVAVEKSPINKLMIAFYPNPQITKASHQQLVEEFGDFLSKVEHRIDERSS